MKPKKIINDPIYGFITIHSELVFRLIDHPWFQRLRRIKQLGLTSMVYPGAQHTRFQHALGAMHLMNRALTNLQERGAQITEEEKEGALIAVLLHDIGHGPFSHALEYILVPGIHHEQLTIQMLHELNSEYDGALSTAISIFTGKYPRPFLHQLVSSQLDLDRLDYLLRDSFFTGVVEGNVALDRIIWMMDVHNDRLVIEEKGIYSVENFLTSRRLMYWQVYMHKTTISTERMLVLLVRRVIELYERDIDLLLTPGLDLLLGRRKEIEELEPGQSWPKELLEGFSLIDDLDIYACLKFWVKHPDPILRDISERFLNRRLFKVKLDIRPPVLPERTRLVEYLADHFQITKTEAEQYYFSAGEVTNSIYKTEEDQILVRRKNGELVGISEASDLTGIASITHRIKKYYLCYPKDISLPISKERSLT